MNMKQVGIILIVLGVLALVYQGIQYTSREKIIDIGSLEVSADTKKTIPLPPIVGGVALVAGIALILADRKKT
jgi:uncharacterized membrane protein YidH (DUF202 family)